MKAGRRAEWQLTQMKRVIITYNWANYIAVPAYATVAAGSGKLWYLYWSNALEIPAAKQRECFDHILLFSNPQKYGNKPAKYREFWVLLAHKFWQKGLQYNHTEKTNSGWVDTKKLKRDEEAKHPEQNHWRAKQN